MVGHIEGSSRDQATLFPERLDELIAAAARVRVVDAFVGMLKLAALGFTKAAPERTGRPSYAASDLLKLYVWGYLNQVRSSRMLERECHRNIEVLWLLNRLAPDFKTIADFRRDNAAAIRLACRAFVQFCKGEGLFGSTLVAVDGSKLAGQNSPKRVWTLTQLEKKAGRLDKKIAEYLERLDAADADESAAEPEPAADEMAAALARLRAQKAEIEQSVLLMQAMEMSQVAVTDPDVRLMRGPHGAVVGFNLQLAVDSKHGLIVHHELTQDTSDQNQLAAMALGAKQALGAERLEAVTDRGYRNASDIKACDEAQVTTFMPPPRPSNGALFDKSRFVYDAESDSYRCPAGRTLRFGNVSKDEMRNYKANAKDCSACALKQRCTKASRRWVTRHRHEPALEALARRTQERPEMMRLRRCLAEHPFGIIKAMMGTPRFLCRGLKTVAAEAALSVTAFNLKRVTNILGVPDLLRKLEVAACRLPA